MPMGYNIREEEQAKVDGLRAVNRMLREQNRVLRELTQKFIDNIQPVDCIEVDLLLQEAQAALTATSQEGQHG